jgi:5-formyltetrahydrofolate cyclo-ligase
MKTRMRQTIKDRLAAMDPGEALAKSRRACERLAGLEEFRRADCVMLYLPIPGEVDTTPLAHAAWEAGKTLAAPKPCPDTRHMRPVLVEARNEDLFHPALPLRSPAGREVLALKAIDLIVVPGLAFDAECNRLGRGGGFYDRFLAHPQTFAATAGLAFAEQIVEELPIQPQDCPVDVVVTDTQVYRRSSNNQPRA